MLNLVKSNRVEVLMEALAALVAQGPDDPFTPEWIGIQSRGMKQWISLRLADILGISAHIRFLFPREIIQLFLDKQKTVRPAEPHLPVRACPCHPRRYGCSGAHQPGGRGCAHSPVTVEYCRFCLQNRIGI